MISFGLENSIKIARGASSVWLRLEMKFLDPLT